ncbi:hypothetical protein [Streptomyces pseudogriseolus]|uniref:hypothetical protein n=1 Tax=Streptomyces pseudogriseolus TaxID=36817 RepID=UPI003FA2A374
MEGISAAVPVAADGDPLDVLAEGGFVHREVAAFDQQFGQQLAILSAGDAHWK